MIAYIASDHRGFALKEALKEFLTGRGHTVHDVTPKEHPGDDYPEAAYALIAALRAAEPDARGIALCGSGAGVAIAANRVPGIRAALGLTVDQITASRHDDNVNILALAADFTMQREACDIADAFLTAPFEPSERYERRIKELDNPPSIPQPGTGK